MKVVFVNYGEFGNNSSNHIDGFARGLTERGHDVGIVADGQPVDPIPGVTYASREGLMSRGDSGALAAMLADSSTLIHAWTPRERVRQTVEPLAREGLRYLVHLEDDEDIVTASQLRRSELDLRVMSVVGLDTLIPSHLSHPIRSRSFLAAASGVTLIAEALRALAPADVPCQAIVPGADVALFHPCGDLSQRDLRRSRLGLRPDTVVLAYHGGIHPAVQRDMFSLYAAIGKLRRMGRDVVLLRIGVSRDTSETSAAFRRADGVIEIPPVSRNELPAWLDLADIYIQPGAPNIFNVRRLPSKLLDFLAMGRPVILPEAYSGSLGADGSEGVHLRQGGAAEIVRCVLRLTSDPALMARLGRRGRGWVEQRFAWADKVEALANFYSTL